MDESSAARQHRVALYLQLQALVFGGFYSYDALAAVRARGAGALAERSLLLHLGLVLAFVAAWLVARASERAPALLQALEAAATFAICAVALGLLELLGARPDQILAGPAFAVMITLVARAAIVPSSGLRTLCIGGAATALVSYGYRPRGGPTDQFAPFVLPWTSAFAFASAYISRVMYGLEREVRQARQLGQYVLEGKLGEGGMGAVYRARHALLRRPTAVKLLLPERAGEGSLARFEREVRHTARLSHPNTITVYDYGRTPGGVFYYAMELLDGANLDDVVAVGGAQPPARVIQIVSAVSSALAEAHDSGLIHRDIKPANIMLCRHGGRADVPKVLDFGLVKDLGGEATLTHAGTLAGTPLYMAPESISDPQAADGRSDLYALGAVTYYLLTGQHVFSGATIVEVCSRHLVEEPVPPSERLGRELPAALEQIVLDCLAKKPERRPQTAAELERSLLAVRDAGTWGAPDAAAWWTSHHEALGRRRAAAALDTDTRTMAVDLSRRN